MKNKETNCKQYNKDINEVNGACFSKVQSNSI